MSTTPPPNPVTAIPILARSMLGTSVVVLAIGAFLHARQAFGGGPEALSWVAAGWAVAATVLAVVVRDQGLVAPTAGHPPPSPADAARRDRKTLLFFAILESGVVLAAVALIVSRPWSPFAAALLPLATMVLNLPSREAV